LLAEATFNSQCIIQPLHRLVGDGLIILDSCHGYIPQPKLERTKDGTLEILTASSLESEVPEGRGPWSFTDALIRELGAHQTRGISVARIHSLMLHAFSQITGRLPRSLVQPIYKISQKSGKKIKPNGLEVIIESMVAPMHYWLAPTTRCIMLRRPLEPGPPQPLPQSDGGWEEGEPEVPASEVLKVLISIRIEEDLSEMFDEFVSFWTNRLGTFGTEDVPVVVEGVWKSPASLVLVSIPVEAWEQLPDDPRISFVGMVSGDNLVSRINSKTSTAQHNDKPGGMQDFGPAETPTKAGSSKATSKRSSVWSQAPTVATSTPESHMTPEERAGKKGDLESTPRTRDGQNTQPAESHGSEDAEEAGERKEGSDDQDPFSYD
jgi:hypothetical protein